MGKNISKSLKCGQKLLDHVKQAAEDAFKTSSKRVIQNKAETTGHLTGNKTADKITRFWKTSPNLIQKRTKRKYLEKNIYHQD